MKKILIIEDIKSMREEILIILQSHGYNVRSAGNGLEGITIAREFIPDLIISDIVMPDMDGYGVLEKLRQEDITSAIPVILTTVKSDREDIRRGMAAGADDYLTKPFSTKELLATVKSGLKKQEILRKNYEKNSEKITKERLKYILSASPAVLFSNSGNNPTGFNYMSDNIKYVLGYSPGDFIETPDFWFKKVHSQDLLNVMSELGNIDKNLYYAGEYRLLNSDGTYRWIYDVRKTVSGSKEIVGSWQDITKKKESEELLARWTNMEELLTNISIRFINSRDIDNDINHCLMAAGEFLSVNRTFLFLLSKEEKRIEGIYGWHGGEPVARKMIGNSFNHFSWFMRHFTEQDIINIPSVSSLGEETKKERKFLLSHGISSILIIPLYIRNNFTGILGIAGENEEKTWKELHIKLIKILGDILQSVIERRQTEGTKKIYYNADNTSMFHNMIGRTAAMQKIFSLIKNLADIDSTVLITGETGTGKELVAEALHHRGIRRHKPLVKVNCPSLQENLQESELFGHVKGAFTGAVKDRTGRFQKASGGTIFLDEIGDISHSMQLKLLRFIQEKEFEPVGDTNTIKIDVRIIAATNQDLEKKVRNGTFREDLYYRLKVMELKLPPLRERKEDIPLLICHFINKYNNKFKKNIIIPSEEVMNLFINYYWPGNIRELKHVIEQAFIVSENNIITEEHLPLHIIEKNRMPNILKDSNEEEELRKALDMAEGKKARAARMLGMSRPTFYKKLKQYGIDDN